MSYKHLPVCLKSCFLHLGLFPEDHDIGFSQLIQLWVTKGLIKPNTRQILEIAEGYVKELIDRNLLLVRSVGLRKRVKTCCIHDLVRDLIIRIAEEEKFACVQRGIDGRPTPRLYPLDIRNQRTRLVCPQEKTTRPCRSRLVRVLVREGGSLDYAMPEVNLRYLFHNSTLHGDEAVGGISLPSSISLMWSLQTLIIGARCHVPSVIWEMPQLRHIDISGFHLPLPRPCPPGGKQDVIVLRNLQTLKRLSGFECTEEVYKRIPNIKDLHIHSSSFDSVYNVGSFSKLESLSYGFHYGFHGSAHPYNPLKGLEFLSEMRELSLRGCNFVWRDTRTLASLPRLEVLVLWGEATWEAECKSVEEGFLSLKHLHISGCDAMVCWFADCSHFLALETLLLVNICKLGEIPSCFGEIATLQRMVLQQRRDSVLRSAIEILEEQESVGNEGLVVEVEFDDQIRAEAFRDEFQLEAAFTNPNLRYTCRFNWECYPPKLKAKD